MRNILKNVVADKLTQSLSELGIAAPLDSLLSKIGVDAAAGNGSQPMLEMRKKFAPLKSGDVVFLAAATQLPWNPADKTGGGQKDLGRTATLLLSSTGATNSQVGGLEVEGSADAVDDIYWCLFRVWPKSCYSDWHVDERRPWAQLGEHGKYKIDSEPAIREQDEDVSPGVAPAGGVPQGGASVGGVTGGDASNNVVDEQVSARSNRASEASAKKS